MDKRETRRINPIAHLTWIVVLLLLIFQALVIAGVTELKAHTVAKYAPWAYESFLRLVGEHPDSSPRWATVEEAAAPPAEDHDVISYTGLAPSAVPVLIETNDVVLSTNILLEATTPREVDAEPVPVIVPTNAPVVEPVG